MSGGAGYATYFRALDPRIGRWLTPDPKVFPWQSPYVSMDGNPVALIDPWGASTEEPPAGASSNPLGEGNEVTAYGKAPQNPVSSSSAFQPSIVNVNAFINTRIQQEFGNTLTKEQFMALTEEINYGLAGLENPARFSFNSYHDELTGRYVFDIQEMTLSTTPLGEINLVGPVTQPPGGGNDWLDPILSISSKANGGLGVATVTREVIEWEYIRQARINRHIAGNFSQPVRHSMRAIKAVGKFTGIGSMVISWADFYYNRSTGNFVQAVVNTGLVFVRVNPVTGIILGISDVTGASDFVYDKIGDAIDNLDSSNAHQDVLKRGSLCFPGDMKVMMACGEFKRIDEIDVGDVVMSYHFDTKTLNPTVVKRVDSPEHYEMVYLRFSKKIEIRSTQDHPIWIEGKGWASVKSELSSLRYKLDVHSLEEGDKCIVYVNGRKKVVKLKRIEHYYENQKTYNLTLLENGISYIVNGIIVSNESNAIND